MLRAACEQLTCAQVVANSPPSHRQLSVGVMMSYAVSTHIIQLAGCAGHGGDAAGAPTLRGYQV
jgi:hypothetical protein